MWYDMAPNMGPRPVDPNDKSRMVIERERIKELVPPAVYMVYGPGKIGNSSTAVVCDMSEGRFGPFAKQLFVPDQSHSNVSRVYLETVNGVKQGVVFPFLKGLRSGPIGARMGESIEAGLNHPTHPRDLMVLCHARDGGAAFKALIPRRSAP